MNAQLLRLKIVQVLVDAMLILAAFALAYYLRIGQWLSSDFPFDKYMIVAALTTPVTLLFMFFIRAYKLSQRIVSLRHIQRLTFVALENVFLFMIIYYFTYRLFFSRLILVYIFALTLLFTYGWHLIFRWIMQKATQHEIGIMRTLIIGANRPAQDLIHLLISVKSHLKPVAVIDPYGIKKGTVHGVPIVGKMNVFEKMIAEMDIDTIIQVDHIEQSLNIINYALANNVRYIMPPELLGIFQGHQTIEEVEGMPLLKVHREKKWWHNLW